MGKKVLEVYKKHINEKVTVKWLEDYLEDNKMNQWHKLTGVQVYDLLSAARIEARRENE